MIEILRSPQERQGGGATLNSAADTLKNKINQYFWIQGKGLYGYFLHGNDGMDGQLDQTEEDTGLSFAVLFGIAGSSQARFADGTLVNPASGKCLDDPGSSTTNGVRLDLWTCNNGSNQHWAIP